MHEVVEPAELRETEETGHEHDVVARARHRAGLYHAGDKPEPLAPAGAR
jgi:hypothetical protein